MEAAVIPGIDHIEVREVPDPVPSAQEVVVEIRAAALNHRDVWIKTGQYAGLKYPCIPGSDGAGVVVAAGSSAGESWIGREVIVNPSFGWGNNPAAQGPEFTILGLPRDGTLARRVAVPIAQLSAKPAHLTWEEAAALPLAGLTAYRALFSRARLAPGERVLVNGVGGGVAVFALQFAAAHGAEAWVTSSAPEKLDRARKLGARGGFLYTGDNWAAAAQKETGGFDVVVDSAGGAGFDGLLDLIKPGGRLVLYGATRGSAQGLTIRKVFWKQISILGSTMGSPGDWEAMLQFASAHRVRPVVDQVFPFSRITQAFALMERGGQFGKIVLSL